jgi:predicted transcriptional regulator
MKSEVYKKKSKHKRRIGRSHYEYCCPHKQKRQDILRRDMRLIAKRVAKCIEVDGGIFERLL